MATNEQMGPHPTRVPDPAFQDGAVEVERLIIQRDSLLIELRRVEWIWHTSSEHDRPWRTCPRCRGVHPRDGGLGHSSDCSLGAALAAADWF